jgi:hypothetical protein
MQATEQFKDLVSNHQDHTSGSNQSFRHQVELADFTGYLFILLNFVKFCYFSNISPDTEDQHRWFGINITACV